MVICPAAAHRTGIAPGDLPPDLAHGVAVREPTPRCPCAAIKNACQADPPGTGRRIRSSDCSTRWPETPSRCWGWHTGSPWPARIKPPAGADRWPRRSTSGQDKREEHAAWAKGRHLGCVMREPRPTSTGRRLRRYTTPIMFPAPSDTAVPRLRRRRPGRRRAQNDQSGAAHQAAIRFTSHVAAGRRAAIKGTFAMSAPGRPTAS